MPSNIKHQFTPVIHICATTSTQPNPPSGTEFPPVVSAAVTCPSSWQTWSYPVPRPWPVAAAVAAAVAVVAAADEAEAAPPSQFEPPFPAPSVS